MKWDVEGWRKLYRSEPLEQRGWRVFCRAFRDHLLRHANDDGTLLPFTKNPAEDLARNLGAYTDERDMVRDVVSTLLEDGYLVHETTGRLRIRNFVDAQERRSREAKRKAAQRAAKKAHTQPDLPGTRAGTSPGTAGDSGPGQMRGSDPIRSDPTRSDSTRSEEDPDEGVRQKTHVRRLPVAMDDTPEAARAKPSELDPPTGESAAQFALRVFNVPYRKAYKRDYLVSAAQGVNSDESCFVRLGRLAEEHGPDDPAGWLHVRAVAYLADRAPWLIDNAHPIRAFEKRINSYSPKGKAPAAPKPAEAPEGPPISDAERAELAKKTSDRLRELTGGIGAPARMEEP